MITRAQGLVAVAIFGGGLFAVGRMTAPTRTHTLTLDTMKSRSETVASAETASATIVVNRDVTRWRDRKVTRPDGTVIETHEALRDVAKRDEQRVSKAEVSSHVETVERLVYRERESVRAAGAPRFVATFGVGALIPPRALPSVVPGLPSRVMLTASVSARVVGPVYAGLWATSTGAVGVGASVAF